VRKSLSQLLLYVRVSGSAPSRASMTPHSQSSRSPMMVSSDVLDSKFKCKARIKESGVSRVKTPASPLRATMLKQMRK